MKVCVLGSHDMLAGSSRGGTVYIAESLAEIGHDVTYVSSPRSLLMRRSGKASALVGERLRQLMPRTLLPMRVVASADALGQGDRAFALNRAVERELASELTGNTFDLCVCSAAATLTLVDHVKAGRTVYRRNDILAGFRGVPRGLLALELDFLRSGRPSLVSCVNEQIAADVLAKAPAVRVNVVPNGIALARYASTPPLAALAPHRERNVLFVGGVTHWMDVPLVLAAARLLPDHEFYLCGPWHIPRPPRAEIASNVHILGPVPHTVAIQYMKACAVGIIPSSAENAGRMVEKPIKFFEYLAAGMGVAATTFAGEGLARYGCVGDSPADFASAIVSAPDRALSLVSEIRAETACLDWREVTARILELA